VSPLDQRQDKQEGSTFPRRRALLALSAAAGAGLLAGCGAAAARADLVWRSDEERRLGSGGPEFDVVLRGALDAEVLRSRAREVPVGTDLDRVAAAMRATMARAQGVGIAGPQVGLSIRVAVLKLGFRGPSPRTIFARNPLILARSDECEERFEGCLSVPDVGGLVRRNAWIRVRYEDDAGREILCEAEGWDAVLWQHELDHLDGVLYVDRVLGDLLPKEEMRRRRKERERQGWRGPALMWA
jgi:peptide deformylase